MIREVNKARAKYLQKNHSGAAVSAETMFPAKEADTIEQRQHTLNELVIENEIIKYLICFGNYIWDKEERVASYLIAELSHLHHRWLNERNERIFMMYYDAVQFDSFPSLHDLLHHENQELAKFAQEISSEKYLLSNLWEEKHGISIPKIEDTYQKAIENLLDKIYLCNILNLIKELQDKLKAAEKRNDLSQINHYLEQKIKLDKEHVEISKALGMVIALPRN
jgi:hypothetical protein